MKILVVSLKRHNVIEEQPAAVSRITRDSLRATRASHQSRTERVRKQHRVVKPFAPQPSGVIDKISHAVEETVSVAHRYDVVGQPFALEEPRDPRTRSKRDPGVCKDASQLAKRGQRHNRVA